MKLINRTYIFCNVADAKKQDMGAFELQLPRLETSANTINRLYIRKAIIPYNWKAITSSTSLFTIDGTTYYFTEGNPTILDIVDEINKAQLKIVTTFNRIKSRIELYNRTGSSVTFSTTALRVLGASSSNPVTIASLATYTFPNPVDVRPDPIVEIRLNITTAGAEVQPSGETTQTTILAGIAMNVPVYSHKVWFDEGGLYFADLQDKGEQIIRVEMQNADGARIVPQSYPYFVWCIDTLENQEKEILEIEKQMLNIQRMDFLLNHPPEPEQQK